MSSKSEYAKKLLDPRWQRRRLEIFDRDEWACRACGGTKITLSVHHNRYFKEPWDAPDENLETICAECHPQVQEIYGMMKHVGKIDGIPIKVITKAVCDCEEVLFSCSNETKWQFLMSVFAKIDKAMMNLPT